MTIGLETLVERTPDVVLREIAGKSLLIPVCGQLADLRRLFVLEGTAGFVWAALERRRTVRNLVEEISRLYAVGTETAFHDLREFLEQAEAQGLVRTAGAPA